jgi:hypothetical protein
MAPIRKPRTPRFTGKHTVVVDWDGTAVKNTWPDKTAEWMPGFLQAVRRWHNAGLAITIHSSRFNPHNPYTMKQDDYWKAEAKANALFIRQALDEAGLSFIGVWDKPGKPTGSVYVDDKAERYGGHVNSWRGVCDKVLLRLGNEDAAFPDYVGGD